MTISSSLNAGVAGLSVNASRLASISQNISNSSTFGYKRVETDFHSIVISNSGSSYSAGGVRATSNKLLEETGSLVSTSNPTDLAVRGRGMLPVMQSGELAASGEPTMALATTGSFRPDDQGYLRSESGLILMGWPALGDGSIPAYPRDTSDGLQPVRIERNAYFALPTNEMEMAVNLPATDTEAGGAGAASELSIEYFDNMGTSQNLEVSFTPTVPAAGVSNEWTMSITDSASNGAVVGEYTLTFNDSRTAGGTLATVTDISGGPYDAVTGKIEINVAGGPISIDIGLLDEVGGLSQLSDSFAPINIAKNGSPVGNMISVEVDQNGYVQALFDTGITRTIYQIPLIDMPNPNGMIALDNQIYLPSPDSGSFFLWDAGDGPTGDIISYSREESATDVAGELTAMIQTQRAYSSNAKVIQTVDEMLQETTNIKR